MTDYAKTGFVLGYGGWCKLRLRANSGRSLPMANQSDDGYCTVPLTAGQYSRQHAVPTQKSLSVPFSAAKRGQIRTGMGNWSFSGSVSFDLTRELCNLILQDGFFARNSFLDFRLCDGNAVLDIPGAVWSSLSISANAGGLVSASIQFSSCNGYRNDIEPGEAPSGEPLEDFHLEPYWRFGGEGLEGFTLSLSRQVFPCYLNQRKWIGPSYLRVGLTDCTFSANCWRRWFLHREVILGDKRMRFSAESFQNEKTYAFGNAISDTTSKTYSISATALESTREVFEILNR